MDGFVLDGMGEKEYLWLEKGLKKSPTVARTLRGVAEARRKELAQS